MSFDGTWDLTVNSPMGAKQFRLTVTTAGGAVQGTVGVGAETLPLVDPVLEDGHLRGAVKLPRPMNVLLDLDLTCDGDALRGTAKAGHMAMPDVSGARVG
jgi:hypothetical protein